MDSIATEAVCLPDGTHVVSVTGPVDLTGADELERSLAAAPAELIVDLTGCEFVDSSVAGPLLRAREARPGEARSVALVAANEHILQLFEMTGLDGLFAIYPTRAAALRGGGHVRLA